MTSRSRKLPPIPAEMFTLLGAIPVVLAPQLLETEEAHGAFGPTQRVVLIDAAEGASLETQWQTFWHELGHVAIWDAGAHEGLRKKQEERVCNAIGTFMVAAMKAGYIKVTAPRGSSNAAEMPKAPESETA